MVAITYHVLALTKLRMYGAAADELRGLGDLDASKYKHDGASTVPFALRYLAAELPFRLSQPQVRIPLFLLRQTRWRAAEQPSDCLHMQELCMLPLGVGLAVPVGRALPRGAEQCRLNRGSNTRLCRAPARPGHVAFCQ